MTESQLYEILGRKQAEFELLKIEYSNAIAVMRGLKDGSCNPDRLTINPDGTWSLAAGDKPSQSQQ